MPIDVSRRGLLAGLLVAPAAAVAVAPPPKPAALTRGVARRPGEAFRDVLYTADGDVLEVGADPDRVFAAIEQGLDRLRHTGRTGFGV